MATAGAIEAGRAFVELYVNDKLAGGLSAAGAKLRGFGTSIMGVGAGLAAAGAAILAPLGAAVNSAVEYGSEIKDASDRTGVAAEELQELRHAAEQSGASFEELEKAIQIMQKTGMGSGAADLEKYADEIAGMTDPAEQTARAMDLFGKGGARLLPLLKSGAAGIAALRQEARDLGIVMSEDDVNAAEGFGDQLANVEKQMSAMKRQIGSALIPVLSQLIDPILRNGAALTGFLRENRAVILLVGSVGAALAAGGLAFIALGAAISGVGIVLGTLAGAITFLMTPMGLLTAAAVGMVAAFGDFSGVGGLGETLRESWAGIVEAVQSGDLEQAFKIVAATLKLEWAKVVAYWTDKWNEFKDRVDPKSQAFGGPGRETFSEIGGSVVAGLGELFGGKELGDEIRKDFQRDMKDIRNPKAARTAEERANDPGLREAQRELDEARATLKQAVALGRLAPLLKAANAAAAGAVAASTASKSAMGAANALRYSSNVTGTFSTGAANLMRFGDTATAEKIEANTKRTADGTDKLNDKIVDAGLKWS